MFNPPAQSIPSLLNLPASHDLPQELLQHFQFPGNFCAVSGFESTAKLERLLAPEEFPLQKNPAHLGYGFEAKHRVYLESIGLEARDEHLNSGAEVAALLIRETDEGRYPLISLPAKDQQTGEWGWHVYVFAKRGGKLLFINPGIRQVLLSGYEPLAGVLDQLRMQPGVPHQTIHVLTYAHRKKRDAA